MSFHYRKLHDRHGEAAKRHTLKAYPSSGEIPGERPDVQTRVRK
jgi:hypothetical protein